MHILMQDKVLFVIFRCLGIFQALYLLQGKIILLKQLIIILLSIKEDLMVKNALKKEIYYLNLGGLQIKTNAQIFLMSLTVKNIDN